MNEVVYFVFLVKNSDHHDLNLKLYSPGMRSWVQLSINDVMNDLKVAIKR